MLLIRNGENAKSVWDICGSFGEFDAEVFSDGAAARAEASGVSVAAECTTAICAAASPADLWRWA